MNAKGKIFLLGVPIGMLLFYATWRLYLKPSAKKEEQRPVTDENIQTAVTAYSLALQDNAPPSDLLELNREFEKDFGLKIHQREDKLVVTNLSGKEIKIV